MNSAVSLFRLLGDETRYKIICSLYQSDNYVERLAEELGLTPGTICFHLKKLEGAGVVRCSRSQFYIIYSLNKEIFNRTIESFLEIKTEKNRDELYRQKVLSSFFVGEKLQSIPVQEKKRLIVLERIMSDFTEETYTEKEVNQIIMLHYDDYCTLRRWLVSDRFMSREREIYTVQKKT